MKSNYALKRIVVVALFSGPGDYVWPGLRATGWDLGVCHVYHEECPPGNFGGCPDSIAEGPGPAPEPVPTESRPCPPFAWMCP